MNLHATLASVPARYNSGSFSARRLCAALAGAAAMVLSTGAAQAADVYWNIGLHAPGAVVQLANAPRVVYGAPPVVVMPAPVYGTAWVPAYPERRWHKHRHHHRRDWDRDWDRRDGDWRGDRDHGDRDGRRWR
ncbi:MAG TPA: hypothetical protein VFY31_03190 [Macromonas sp.]|nr:hypothetical protein [Macromonas sp.]